MIGTRNFQHFFCTVPVSTNRHADPEIAGEHRWDLDRTVPPFAAEVVAP
jgi:hypothetical protein